MYEVQLDKQAIGQARLKIKILWCLVRLFLSPILQFFSYLWWNNCNNWYSNKKSAE